MVSEKVDTKNRIIETATILFAEKGYHGASIRNIAKEAGVNLSAINYHFKNKDYLLFSVIMKSKNDIDKDFEKSSSDLKMFNDCAYMCYKVLQKNAEKVINQYKLFLNRNVMEKIVTFISKSSEESKDFGPPGSILLNSLLEKQYGNKLSKAGRAWILEKIYADMSEQIFKTYGLQFAPEGMKEKLNKACHNSGINTMSKEWIYVYIDCIINYVLNNPQTFK